VSGPRVPRHQPPSGDAIGRWRLRHDPSSAALARRLVTQALSSPPRPAADQVQRRALLATSELVANAIRHARMPLDLEVRRTDAGWLVAVTDGDATAPQPRQVDHLAENGRGLLIVNRSSDRAGWAPAGNGKTVWVELWEPGETT
jgi:anti-sigma regulatory factor (Ser/Thr protein kinase)